MITPNADRMPRESFYQYFADAAVAFIDFVSDTYHQHILTGAAPAASPVDMRSQRSG